MNILFTICGRAGSKGLKNKNLKIFLGQPLVYHTMTVIEHYSQLYGAADVLHTCLNTDSEDLISLVHSRNPDVFVVQRSSDLAGDTVPKMAVVQDCLQKAAEYYGVIYDMVIDLDITSPLRTVDDVKRAINKKRGSPNIDIVFSVTSARRNPYFNMVKRNEDGTVSKVIESNYTARQQVPQVYDMNASIYVYSSAFLLNNTSNMLFDGVCDIIEMRDTAVLDIDSEEDFELMEIIYRHFVERYNSRSF